MVVANTFMLMVPSTKETGSKIKSTASANTLGKTVKYMKVTGPMVT